MQATDLGHGRGWLDAPAAASLARMDAARGDWLRTTSTGRTRAEQAEAYRKYLNGGSYAAKPGQSPHEPGLAADFHNTAWVWLLEHGEEHGWFLTISSEPWHRVYRAAKDHHRNHPAPAGEEEDMLQDDEREALMAIKVALLDGRPQAGMAKGALDLILENTTSVQTRLMAPAGGEWDAFDELVRNSRILVARNPRTGEVDAEALAASLRDGLGAEVAADLAKRLAE